MGRAFRVTLVGVLLIFALHSFAQVVRRVTSSFYGIVVDRSYQMQGERAKDIAGATHVIAKGYGFTCRFYEVYTLADTLAAVISVQESLRNAGLTYKPLAQQTQGGQQLTYFSATSPTRAVFGLWSTITAQNQGVLSLCKVK